MSDLIVRILSDKTSVEEVVRWLLSSEMTVQKEGYTKTAFARYLLDFLRKHTLPLLPKQETNAPLTEALTTKPLNTSTPLRTPSHESCQNFTSVLSTPKSSDSRSMTPIYNRDASSSGSRSTVSSSCNSSSVSQNTSASSASRELLERRFTSRDSSRSFSKSVQLEDYIVVKEKPKRKKRIKPTKINKMQENISGTPFKEAIKSGDEQAVMKRVTPTQCNRVNESPDNRNEPIKILKRVPFAQVDQQVQQVSPMKTFVDQQASISDTDVKMTEMISASPEIKLSVDIPQIEEERKISIKKLALLYSAVMTANYSQDLLKELNYLMSLLSLSMKLDINQSGSPKTEDVLSEDGQKINLFQTKGEGIYFAAIVLEQQWCLLKQLTSAVLSILAQILNPLFPEFASRICDHVEKRKSGSQNINIVDREMLSGTVKFKMDTDCRPNYVNDQLFCAFKKQRDDFYVLMQEWEDETNRGHTSADFFKAKLKRVRSILTTSTASTIMHRLADLFVSQILASTLNENRDNRETLSVDGITPTKFDLLNKRISAPSFMISEKRFPGVQEFFKDFLRTSSAENSFFTSHVRDVLVQRISTLNGINISSETSVASVRQELYLVCINKLCILAKFLSLITFLPYQDKEILPPHLRIPLVDARRHTLPPLDLNSLLVRAIESGRILITVPWIVEFMYGIDDTSIQLLCYQLILAKLQYLLYKIRLPSSEDSCEGNIFCIYTRDAENSIANKNGNMNGVSNGETGNRMNISQLKELASKTASDFTKRFVNECLQTIECSRILITLYVNSLFNNISISTIINLEDMTSLKISPVLICSEFYINDFALYRCFPQLNELKSILEGRKKLSYKSVAPKTKETFCDHQTNEVALDMQLEMHFFDNMSHSVKHAVDVVAKQVSSHCISVMRDKVIPELKTRLCEQMKTALLDETPTDQISNIMLAKFYNILRRALKEELSTFYDSVESSLKGMLKPDVREDFRILNTCIDVTCRKCIEITYNWIFNYISFEGMVEEVTRVASEEVARLRKTEHKISKKNKNYLIRNEFDALMMSKSEKVMWTSPGPVNILHRFRLLTRTVIANSDVNISHEDAYCSRRENEVTGNDVVCLVKDAISCIEGRTDLQFITFRRIMLISLDMISMFVFLRPDLVVVEILQLLAKMWTYRKDCKLHLHYEHVLSSRNIEIYLRRTEREQKDVRECLSRYFHFVLANNLMHASRLFRQVLKLLQHEWPCAEVLRPILVCVKEVLEECRPHKQKILCALESMIAIVE